MCVICTALNSTDLHAHESLQQGQHVCLLYEDSQDPVHLVAPYIAFGLAQNERCVYILGEHDQAYVEQTLLAQGIDAPAEIAKGRLILVSQWDVSFPNGEFDAVVMVDYVRATIRDTMATGFSGLRIIAEMTWVLQAKAGSNKLIHFEALGDKLFSDKPLAAICMYNRSRFPMEVCQDAIRFHPWVTTGDEANKNPYYDPPGAFLSPQNAAQQIEQMLSQIKLLKDAAIQKEALHQSELARTSAESAAKARDDLLSMLGHELRTPIAAVQLRAELMGKQLSRGKEFEPSQIEELMTFILKQTKRQTLLIQQILDAAQNATSALPIQPVFCDLSKLAAEVVELIQTTTHTHPISLNSSGKVMAYADPVPVEQLLLNLISNAIKFCPPNTPIEVSVGDEQDWGVIAVSDQGPGISPEHQDKIFHRYKRHGDAAGLGLGLYLCSDIVRRHHGTITLESPSSGGARFVSRFPKVAVKTDVTSALAESLLAL